MVLHRALSTCAFGLRLEMQARGQQLAASRLLRIRPGLADSDEAMMAGAMPAAGTNLTRIKKFQTLVSSVSCRLMWCRSSSARNALLQEA